MGDGSIRVPLMGAVHLSIPLAIRGRWGAGPSILSSPLVTFLSVLVSIYLSIYLSSIYLYLYRVSQKKGSFSFFGAKNSIKRPVNGP